LEEILHGIRVLDFSCYKSGPYCGMLLADMGAEVIRVEKPKGGEDRLLGPFAPDGQSMYLMFTCRNKKGITLNLRTDKGQEILKELVKRADVVLENFGVNVAMAMGLGYKSLKEIKPDIILVSVSGYGQSGDYAHRVCFDSIAQAESGVMWLTGFPEGRPTRAGVNLVDFSTGIYAALGTMLALYHRQRTGEGQMIDIGLLDAAMSFMESAIAEYEVLGEVRPQVGNANVFAAPYDAYKAKDGYVYIAVVGDSMWRRFLKVVGREDLSNDPRFKTDSHRAKNHQFFTNLVGQWVAEKEVGGVVSQLNEAGIPCGRVNTIPQVAADPHIRDREMLVEVEHPGVGKVPLIGIPIKLSKTPGKIKTVAPMLGEHNEEIYCDLLGYTHQELNQLKNKGVI